MHKINPTTDPFYQLIKHTPNVKDLQVYPSPKKKVWNYIALAISENDKWNLRSLPHYFETVDNPYSLHQLHMQCKQYSHTTQLDKRNDC